MASESILISTKEALGYSSDYTAFDPEIVMYINSVLADFQQLGVGPEEGFSISGSSQLWSDLTTDPRLNSVRALMYLRVRMLHDPPTIGFVITAMEKQIEKTEWRLSVAVNEINRELEESVTDVEIT